VAVAAIAVTAGILPVAHATIDQTPPNLTVGLRPAFVVGSVVEDYQLEGFWYTRNVQQLIRWSATDDVGVCSYDLDAVPAGAPPEPLLEYSQETNYTFLAGDYDDDFGGGSLHIDGFLVTARDCTGNATTKAMTDRTLVTIQEDGASATASPWQQEIVYTGAWSQGNCDCFLAQHTSFARAAARATFTRTYGSGDRFAVVMAMGPGRGKVGIRIDGSWVATVDTLAATNLNRVVVFEHVMAPGTHTVTLVNQATPGRPRIDLDAILLATDDPFGTTSRFPQRS
jgi:hypothetical protein